MGEDLTWLAYEDHGVVPNEEDAKKLYTSEDVWKRLDPRNQFVDKIDIDIDFSPSSTGILLFKLTQFNLHIRATFSIYNSPVKNCAFPCPNDQSAFSFATKLTIRSLPANPHCFSSSVASIAYSACFASGPRPCWKIWINTNFSVRVRPRPVSSQIISPGSCCVMSFEVSIVSEDGGEGGFVLGIGHQAAR